MGNELNDWLERHVGGYNDSRLTTPRPAEPPPTGPAGATWPSSEGLTALNHDVVESQGEFGRPGIATDGTMKAKAPVPPHSRCGHMPPFLLRATREPPVDSRVALWVGAAAEEGLRGGAECDHTGHTFESIFAY